MEAKLCFIGHGLMENRSGLIVDARLTRVSARADQRCALTHPTKLTVYFMDIHVVFAVS
jgi:hypothetical protein